MPEVVIAAIGRTPIGRAVKGSLIEQRPDDLGAYVVDEVLKQIPQLDRGQIEDVDVDVDVVEINEAFAAQVIPAARGLGIDPFGDTLNPHGGAIALGHPFGMTGVRILATLLNDLRTRDETIGLETMCVGGGQGMAMIIERLS